jgi:hypothetical protein
MMVPACVCALVVLVGYGTYSFAMGPVPSTTLTDLTSVQQKPLKVNTIPPGVPGVQPQPQVQHPLASFPLPVAQQPLTGAATIYPQIHPNLVKPTVTVTAVTTPPHPLAVVNPSVGFGGGALPVAPVAPLVFSGPAGTHTPSTMHVQVPPPTGSTYDYAPPKHVYAEDRTYGEGGAKEDEGSNDSQDERRHHASGNRNAYFDEGNERNRASGDPSGQNVDSQDGSDPNLVDPDISRDPNLVDPDISRDPNLVDPGISKDPNLVDPDISTEHTELPPSILEMEEDANLALGLDTLESSRAASNTTTGTASIDTTEVPVSLMSPSPDVMGSAAISTPENLVPNSGTAAIVSLFPSHGNVSIATNTSILARNASDTYTTAAANASSWSAASIPSSTNTTANSTVGAHGNSTHSAGNSSHAFHPGGVSSNSTTHNHTQPVARSGNTTGDASPNWSDYSSTNSSSSLVTHKNTTDASLESELVVSNNITYGYNLAHSNSTNTTWHSGHSGTSNSTVTLLGSNASQAHNTSHVYALQRLADTNTTTTLWNGTEVNVNSTLGDPTPMKLKSKLRGAKPIPIPADDEQTALPLPSSVAANVSSPALPQ